MNAGRGSILSFLLLVSISFHNTQAQLKPRQEVGMQQGNWLFHLSLSGAWVSVVLQDQPGFAPYVEDQRNFREVFIGLNSALEIERRLAYDMAFISGLQMSLFSFQTSDIAVRPAESAINAARESFYYNTMLVYAAVPLKFRFYFGRQKLSPYVNLALSPEWAMSAAVNRDYTLRDGSAEFTANEFEDFQIRKLNGSAAMGIGASYNITERFNAFAELTYHQFLLPIWQYGPDERVASLRWTFGLSYISKRKN